jgi:hypothetical protein
VPVGQGKDAHESAVNGSGVLANAFLTVVCAGGTVFPSHHTHARRPVPPISIRTDTRKAVRTRCQLRKIGYELLTAGLHLRRYTTLLHQHFSSSVLNSLPEWLRRMDDVGNDGLSMGKRSFLSRTEFDANAEVLVQSGNQIKIYQF